MKGKLARVGRVLILACGIGLSAVSVLVIVSAGDLAVQITAALTFAAGLIIILLSMILLRFAVFGTLLRHLQYLTQCSEYMARLLREITEVMKAIEEAEAQERSKDSQSKDSSSQMDYEPITPEERELESMVRQFEM
jgi:hypothetical protein